MTVFNFQIIMGTERSHVLKVEIESLKFTYTKTWVYMV